MKLKLYVLYSDYGQYEGCSAPEDVVLIESKASEWSAKNPETNTYAEFEIDLFARATFIDCDAKPTVEIPWCDGI